MGQPMEVLSTTVVDDIAMFATDRGITGQEGVSLSRGDESDGEYPAALASEVMGLDDGIDHVFVASNQVVARRPEGWDDGLLEKVRGIVTRFFVFYDEA